MQVERSDLYKILVVEDDEILCDLISKTLQKSGFQTDIALTGKEAIEKIGSIEYLLLLLDYHLSDMNGKQVIESLTSQNLEIPFVIMTGHGDERVAVEMMKLKSRDYLIKDINFIDLVPISVSQVVAQIETEKKLAKTEESLKESDERFRSIYHESPIGIAVYDQFGKAIDANKACLNIYDIHEVSELGNLFDDPNIPNNAKERLNKGNIIAYETKLDLKSSIYVNILISPLGLYSKGYLDSYLVHIQDVTEKKNAELQLQKMKDDLEIKVNERTAQLAKANEELLHEISERKEIERRLEDYNFELQLFTEVSSELVANTVYNANKMQSLLNSLLDYSRIGMDSDYLQATDCEVVLNNTLAELSSLIMETNAEITFDHLPIIEADTTQIAILFRNLIENAIKFRKEEPLKVHISSEKKENEWIFSIKDNGIGIEPEYKDIIFTIFSRINSTNGYSGTGIGLAMCKKIIECHSGHIWVESIPNEGSTFYFSIPR
ncbi:TPA: response regulator [bacterium]|nr:response regulator [bacterium]